jgi:branched-chain amino acid transport system ATP-binding protein
VLVVARAMVAKPKFVFLDDMSLGLASVIVERLLRIVRNLADQAGCSVLLSNSTCTWHSRSQTAPTS